MNNLSSNCLHDSLNCNAPSGIASEKRNRCAVKFRSTSDDLVTSSWENFLNVVGKRAFTTLKSHQNPAKVGGFVKDRQE